MLELVRRYQAAIEAAAKRGARPARAWMSLFRLVGISMDARPLPR